MRWSVILLKDKRIVWNVLDCWQHLLRESKTSHSGVDKDQLSHTHFRHSNGNHNVYLQYEAKFMIFRILKFPQGKICTTNR